MSLKRCYWIISITIVFCFSVNSQATERYPFVVVDQQGLPLSDTVIESLLDVSKKPHKSLPLTSIDQVNKQFTPQQIIIQKGQSVEFPNSDNIRHHVYSFSKAKVFELKLYANKPEAPITFNEAGVVVLGCNIHDSMIGYIYVADSNQTVVTDDNGSAEIIVDKPIKAVRVWHAQQADGAESQQILNLDTLSHNTRGQLMIKVTTVDPLPRNSFEDVFGVVSPD